MRYFSHVLALLPLAFASPINVPRATDDVQPIPGKYIVVMKPQTSQLQMASTAMRGVTKEHTYEVGNFKGFSAALSDAQVDALNADTTVDYIEQDVRVKIAQQTNAITIQSSATWGLGRISHRARGSTQYAYDTTAGEGTCAYIIDTGILPTHSEFEGRASIAKVYEQGDGTNQDANGHGTHVAGTIGGKTYGVAKKTKLRSVKVCDSGGYCTLSNVIAAVQFVADDSPSQGCTKGTVANLSLGAPNSQWRSLKSTIAAVSGRGIFVAVAAGNDAADANGYSPASEATACTTGASDNTDAIAYFSNYGSVVDIFAPGLDITSAWIGSNTATNTISGTSMASPHIAGLGAYLLALEGSRTPTALCTRIRDLSTKNALSGIPSGTANYLAFNGAT